MTERHGATQGAGPEAVLQLCVWRIGTESFAVDLRRVEAVLAAPPMVEDADLPQHFDGVARFRGLRLPVVDVRKRLVALEGLGTAKAVDAPGKRRERLVVCRLATRRVGFIVDAVTQVLRVPRAALRAVSMAQERGARPIILGRCGEPPARTLLLDVKALVSEVRP